MFDIRAEKLRRGETTWVAIHDILLSQWDPIGMKNEPNAQDEYDMYIAGVWGLLDHGADEDQLVRHLDDITTKRMGYTSHPEASRPAAKSLLAFWQADKGKRVESN